MRPRKPLSVRLYRRCLRLYPRSFRERFGEEMVELFELSRRKARRARGARSRWAASTLLDLVGSAAWQWLWRLRSRWSCRTPRSRSKRSEPMRFFLQDLKQSIFGMVRQPWTSVLVIGMLAAGIGGNVAVFTLVNGLLLRPLPYPHPGRLVYLNETAPRWNLDIVGIDYHDFHVWRAENRTFESMAVLAMDQANVSFGGREPERIELARVTHDLTPLLGARIVLGRGFLPEEDRPGGPPVAILGRGLWESRLEADLSVVGTSLQVDGEPHTIVGVAEIEHLGLGYGGDCRMLLPLAEDPTVGGESYYLDGFGRLQEGQSLETALQDLSRIQKRIVEIYPRKEAVGPVVLPFREPLVREFETAAWLLWGAVGIVFLVACANAASLILARTAVRSRELALRRALGAGRSRILGQLLTEGLALSVAGGMVGIPFGALLLELLGPTLLERLPSWARFDMDGRVAAFAVAISFGAPLLVSLVPALQASSGSLRANLQDGGRGASSGKSRTLGTLVVLETALALLLLVSAGLLSRTFLALKEVDPGFRPENALSFRVSLPESKYSTPESRHRFFDELVDGVSGLPGIDSAAASNLTPFRDHWGAFFETEGAPPRSPAEPNPVVLLRVATPGYLRTIGIELLAGRDFDETDAGPDRERVAIVNEEFRNLFFGEGDPIGRRIRHEGSDNPWVRVVGIVRDLRHYGVDRDMRPGVYLPLAQSPVSSMALVVRSSLPPDSIVAACRDLVREMDPELPLFDVSTLSDRLDRSLQVRRLYAGVFGAFAAVALALTLGGIYGVLSYVVSQKTREIGIRVALGAVQREVLRLVLERALRLVMLGAAVGLAAAFFGAKLFGSLLHGVEPRDPATYLAITASLVLVALLASLPPALRAARIEPTKVLRLD